MHLFYSPDLQQGNCFLSPDESRHCVKVLRKKKGDNIHITDGFGNFYEGALSEVNQKKCTFELVSKKTDKKPEHSIHIALSPTKNADRIEWFIEKSVEIGIQKISFFQASFSERKHINLARIKKKAVSAMKQSMRAYMPEIGDMVDLKTILDNNTIEEQKYVAHLEGNNTNHLLDLAKPAKSYLILIGPEGGFSSEEISMIKKKNFTVAKIGNYRLRTETAGVVACSILNDINYQR